MVQKRASKRSIGQECIESAKDILDYAKEQAKHRAKNTRLMKTYGIRLFDYWEMLKEQNGVCWICQTLPKNGILCVDHLHQKGFKKMPSEEKRKYVRGLLCFSCNTAFGRIERRKSPRLLLERVVLYFDRFPIKGDKI